MDSQTRTITLERKADDSGLIPCVISTETPVERNYGEKFLEVLDHSSKSVDLSRAPLPLLESHHGDKLNIGVIEGLRIIDRKLRGKLRLGNTSRAKEIKEDIRAGIIRSMSVGYFIRDTIEEFNEALGVLTVRVIDWQPFEASLVAIPADPNAGLNRNLKIMNKETISNTDTSTLSRSERKKIRDEVLEEERVRTRNIRQISERFNCVELGEHAITNNTPIDVFRQQVIDRLPGGKYADPASAKPATFLNMGGLWDDRQDHYGIPENELEGYSLFRACDAFLDKDWSEAGLEKEVHNHLVSVMGKRSPQGILVPNAYFAKATRTVGKVAPNTEGAALVGTQHLSSDFVDILRNKSVVMDLGARMIQTGSPGGDISIPRQDGSVTVTWIAEDGTQTDSDATFDAITMAPKTASASCAVTRRMLKQGLPDVENLITSDIVNGLGIELDLQALQGDGTGNTPVGVLNIAGVNSLTPASTTYVDMVNMLGELGTDNTDQGALAFVTTPSIRTTLMTTEEFSNSGRAVWTHQVGNTTEGRIAGFRAFATNNMPAATTLFGNWDDLIIAMWGVIDVLPDPYTTANKGGLHLRAFWDVDINVRHPESFCKSV